MAEAVNNMTADEQLRFMQGVRLAARLFRRAEALGDVGGGGLWNMQATYRPGHDQARLLAPALLAIGSDCAMLAGFDAAVTDFIGMTLNVGEPNPVLYEVLSFADATAERAESRCVDAMFRQSVGLAEGAVHG